MNFDIFREYDIRGITGLDLTPKTVAVIAKAIGTYLRRKGAKRIAVGYDARESSPEFADILTRSLNETGCDVLLIGMVPTPVLYHTVYTKDVDGGVMITGSHNPSDHNGFKICLGRQTLFGGEILGVRDIVDSGKFETGTGICNEIAVLNEYKKDVASGIDLGGKKLKVVVDAGSGMGGVTAIPVLGEMGVEVIELFCQPDSSFPNHPPDPAMPENLEDTIFAVKKHCADLGIAFDGDGDRIAVIDDRGEIMWGDELTTIFAQKVLARNPGATVIGEVKCSQRLFDEVRILGGNAVMSKAGHSIIKAKMVETGALLAGEMSGHIFFADRYYGFDDACYAALRLLEILSGDKRSLSEIRSELPQTFSSPEIRISCPEESKLEIINLLEKKYAETHELITIDGVRISFDEGWGLVRASNTQAILVLRFEAESESELARITTQVESDTFEILRTLGVEAE